MIEFGKTLRLAREAKGYTAAQVAELTRMAPSTVAELEEENFSRIAAPIYGRGFVKLYCEAVGIDPKPLIDEFMSMFNGERSTGIRDRKVGEPVAAEPPPVDLAPPPQTPPPSPSAADLLTESAEPPASAGVEPPPPAPLELQGDVAEPPHERTLSRYAAPVRTMHVPSVPPAVWRMGILGTLALLLLWGLAVGVRALYRATTSDTPAAAEEPAAPTPPQKVAPAAPAAQARPAASSRPAHAQATAKPTPPKPKAAAPTPPKPKAARASGRTPQKIPSIYAD